MNDIKKEIEHRRLTDMVMPGTHDSALSKLTTAILSGAADSNTQTQLLNVHDQLRVGARWFDLRVSSVHN